MMSTHVNLSARIYPIHRTPSPPDRGRPGDRRDDAARHPRGRHQPARGHRRGHPRRTRGGGAGRRPEGAAWRHEGAPGADRDRLRQEARGGAGRHGGRRHREDPRARLHRLAAGLTARRGGGQRGGDPRAVLDPPAAQARPQGHPRRPQGGTAVPGATFTNSKVSLVPSGRSSHDFHRTRKSESSASKLKPQHVKTREADGHVLPTSRAGMSSPKPIASSASTAGTGRPSPATACGRSRSMAATARPTSPASASGCGRERPSSCGRAAGRANQVPLTPGQAHEFAAKAAETDATKRALMTFGNAFGLSLYGGGTGGSLRHRWQTSGRGAAADAGPNFEGYR